MTETNTNEFFGSRVKKNTKEQLYESVRIYLEARIKYPRNPKLENGFLYELFKICEKEIIEREMEKNKNVPYEQQKRSEYLTGLGEILVKAGIMKSHPYDITDRRLIN